MITLEKTLVTDEQIRAFQEEGFVRIENFYDADKEILPIQEGIYNIIGLLIKKHRLPIDRRPFNPAHFDDGFMALIQHDRKLGGVVYDAVKQIPAFMRLLASPKNEEVFRLFRRTDFPGIATAGFGIRIDIPGEEKFLSPWHQEFLAHLRSPDGLVFWSPLIQMTEELGPVRVCPTSHREGLLPVTTRDPENPDKSGAYSMRLLDEESLLKKYPSVAPLSKPGDLIALDYLTLHASSPNLAHRPRWSMQLRYFNFKHPEGQNINWRGSIVGSLATIEDLKQLYPDYLAYV